MSALTSRIDEAEAALRELGGDIERVGKSRWNVKLGGSSIEIRAAAGWLLLTRAIGGEFPVLEVLRWNERLPGVARFALAADGGLELRAEIPGDDVDGLAPWLGDIRRGFEVGGALSAGQPIAALPADASGPSGEELQRLCEEEGWACTPPHGGTFKVTLDCAGAFHQATVQSVRGGVHLAVEFGQFPEARDDAELAAAMFLLTASREVRLARPVWREAAGQVKPGFEVTFSQPPTAAQLTHSFSALSLATQECAAEVPVLLQNPDVASQYLVTRHGQLAAPAQP